MFVVTMKNLQLYPMTSQTNVQGLRTMHEWFTGYLASRGAITLEVTKDSLLNPEGEQVYHEKQNEAYLAFPLFRDGVQSLFIEPGVAEDELRDLMLILLKFRTTNESAQDDVVTSMWDAGFQYIKYAVADEYEEVDSEFDLGLMVCARPPSTKDGGPVRIDPDAPGMADAPVQTDGAAPIAKSIGSLFALADSLDFSFAPGGADGRVADPHEGGKLQPSQGGGSAGGAGGAVRRVVVSGDAEGVEEDLSDEDEEEDDGGFGPMGGAAGPELKPPPGAGADDGGFFRDDSGRVRRGTGPEGGGQGAPGGGNGVSKGAGSGNGAARDPSSGTASGNGASGAPGEKDRDPSADAEPGDGEGGVPGGGGGGPAYRGSGVGGPRRSHRPDGDGEQEGDRNGDGDYDYGDESLSGSDSPYGPHGSVYDPDGDPDGHPVKGPPGAEGETSDSGGGSAFGDALQNLDLSSLNTDSFDERTEMAQPVTLADEDAERPEIDEKTREGRAQRLKYWGLSSREIKQVAALIQWDEARGKTASVLDLVMVLVKSPVLRPSMLPSLTSFLAEEIRMSCERLSLAHVNAFLARLQDLAARAGWEGPCARLRLELQKVIAEPGMLEILCEAVADDDVCAQSYDSIRYFLYQLPQGSAASIVTAMPSAKSLSLKRLFVEVICWQLPSVLDKFAQLATTMNEWSILELLGLLAAMRKPLAQQVKTAFLKHPAPEVRIRTAKLMLDMDPDSVPAVSHLIVDPDAKVRSQIAPFVIRRRDVQVEGILRSHLSSRYSQKQNGPDLLEHYRRLGVMGGRGSLPFLTEVLMKRDLGSLFGAALDYHRTGSALALMLMPESSGAGDIVKKASRSAFRAVRSAVHEAEKLCGERGE
jgi:hypothetical protein